MYVKHIEIESNVYVYLKKVFRRRRRRTYLDDKVEEEEDGGKFGWWWLPSLPFTNQFFVNKKMRFRIVKEKKKTNWTIDGQLLREGVLS